MKTTLLRLVLITSGILAVFVAGFVVGGVEASTSAARAANASSLVYFTGIHDALNQQNYDQAARITDAAIDGHVGVLRLAGTWPSALAYVLPVGRTREIWITSVGIDRVRKSYQGQPDKLRPETRDFIAASH